MRSGPAAASVKIGGEAEDSGVPQSLQGSLRGSFAGKLRTLSTSERETLRTRREELQSREPQGAPPAFPKEALRPEVWDIMELGGHGEIGKELKLRGRNPGLHLSSSSGWNLRRPRHQEKARDL